MSNSLIWVRSREALRLGTRMTRGHGRSGVLRPVASGLVACLAVALLLGVQALLHAGENKASRERARNPVAVQQGRLLWAKAPGDDHWRGHAVTQILIAPAPGAGPSDGPLPPGLDRLPLPGEVALSPRLARLTRSAQDLRTRFAGLRQQSIGEKGLTHADELIAYVGVPTSQLTADTRANRITVRRVGGYGSADGLDEQGVGMMTLLSLTVIVLLPFCVVCASLARLGAAAREKRLTSLRLIGLSPGTVRIAAAVESGLASMVGSILGIAIFWIFRSSMAAVTWMGWRPFLSDLSVAPISELVTSLAVTGLAVSVGMVAAGRVHTLGRTTRPTAEIRPVRRAGLIVLFIGVLLAAVHAAWITLAPPHNSSLQLREALLWDVGAIVIAAGITLALPAILQLGARFIAGTNVTPVARLTARRIEADPGSVTRVGGVFAILLFILGLAFTFISTLDSSHDVRWAARYTNYHGRTIISAPLADQKLLESPEFAAATSDAITLPVFRITGADSKQPVPTLVADCDRLRRLSASPILRCPKGPARIVTPDGMTMPGTPVAGTPLRVAVMRGFAPVVRWPAETVTIDAPIDADLDGLLVIDPATPWVQRLPANTFSGVVVSFPASRDRLEHIRATIARVDPLATVKVPGEAVLFGSVSTFQAATSIIKREMMIAALIVLIGLGTVVLDAASVRARQQMPLRTLGIHPGALARVMVAETLTTLLVAGLMGMLAASALGYTYVESSRMGIERFPADALGLLGLAALLFAISISAACWLNALRAGALSALRNE